MARLRFLKEEAMYFRALKSALLGGQMACTSGVSRKSEGTKCQKFIGNEIHWERIPLSKFLYYILQWIAKKFKKEELKYEGVITYISRGNTARRRRAKN